MLLITFYGYGIAGSILMILLTMFGVSFTASLLFWLIYRQKINKG